MLILAGKPLGYRFAVLDRRDSAPAAPIADHLIIGDLYDAGSLEQLTSWADVTTFEIEHADTDALIRMEADGARIMPAPGLLALINDKLRQKDELSGAGIPVPAYSTETPAGYPCVQKLRYGGYDGRGVTVLGGPDDTMLEGPSMFEEKIDLAAELSVLVARRPSGESVAYPPVDLHFLPEANIQARASAPSLLPAETQAAARSLARQAVEAIDGVGVLAVELFLARDGVLLVNEIAPRPHNSGHLTIEACRTSQFEQHLRAITDTPLGSPELIQSAVCVNLLGAPDAAGEPDLQSVQKLLDRPGVRLHWYHKEEVRPYRKMGHVTIVAGGIKGDFGAGESSSVGVDALHEVADSLEDLCWVRGRMK